MFILHIRKRAVIVLVSILITIPSALAVYNYEISKQNTELRQEKADLNKEVTKEQEKNSELTDQIFNLNQSLEKEHSTKKKQKGTINDLNKENDKLNKVIEDKTKKIINLEAKKKAEKERKLAIKQNNSKSKNDGKDNGNTKSKNDGNTKNKESNKTKSINTSKDKSKNIVNNNIKSNKKDNSVKQTSNKVKGNYRTLSMEITNYVAMCNTGCTGITFTGIDVRNTIYHPSGHRIVAVDPSVIPLGSIVEVDGVKYKAADTGGAIKGNKLDLLVSSRSQAINFGRQTKQVKIWR